MSTQETTTEETNKIPFVIPKGTFGQPTCHTHPHLIKEEHLTWGITQAEYKKRRETLVQKLVAESENMHNTHISILFVHDKDAHAELWEGPRTGCAAAARLFCMDESRPVENFSTFLNKITQDSKPAVLWYHNEDPANPDIHNTKRLIELLGEQRPALDKLFDSMCRLLGKHLQEEGILPKNVEGHELLGKAYRLCPHHVSHYLGLDVHDAPVVRRNVPVCTNMIVTVEPGIYIRPDDTTVPKEFRGVGIRVEDDVLITDAEPVVLTDACVKEVADIEAIVGKHSL
ncbi:hypothetical protein HF086_002546 [Spodoptera exigua]|uniref:Aminopeptidase P N-terminal domain-containing protein n=1 Tax=Spodoptera exigua TaxID=7107 RepID=A0A922M4C1_SPOEX|nr:hypothetical protein HF086_002546 [Spodoptera exigua]